MKAKELRFTNLVLFDGVITEIGITQICNFSFWEKHEKEFYTTRWQPITLTEEWLLNFGFIEKKKWFYKEKFILGYLSTDDHLQGEWKFGGTEGGWNLINIKYVHQLQNLYFALTGEELELKK